MTREEAKDYIREWCPYDRQEEIIKALEQEPCEDAISRQAAIDVLAIGEEFLKRVLDEVDVIGHEREKYEWGLGLVESYISDMEELPSVTPQLTEALDKIRAEVLDEAEYAYADFEQYKVDYLGADAEYVEDELPQDDFRYGMERAIEIIDKYKVKSEGQA